MPTHTYHEALPDYDPDAILQHGCEECERRAGIQGLRWLDEDRSRRAVERAEAWNRDELTVTPTEARLLEAVWSVIAWIRNNNLDVQGAARG